MGKYHLHPNQKLALIQPEYNRMNVEYLCRDSRKQKVISLLLQQELLTAPEKRQRQKRLKHSSRLTFDQTLTPGLADPEDSAPAPSKALPECTDHSQPPNTASGLIHRLETMDTRRGTTTGSITTTEVTPSVNCPNAFQGCSRLVDCSPACRLSLASKTTTALP